MKSGPIKPHLIKMHGVWHCGLLRCGVWQRLGAGYTPEQAYEDWEKGRAR